MALDRARKFIAARTTFAMETTLSGRAHLRLVRAAREAGLSTALLFFTTPDPAICLARIARRVAEGGHDVDEAIVLRRFGRGLGAFADYAADMTLWRVYEASGHRPRVAADGAGRRVVHAVPDLLRRLPGLRLP